MSTMPTTPQFKLPLEAKGLKRNPFHLLLSLHEDNGSTPPEVEEPSVEVAIGKPLFEYRTFSREDESFGPFSLTDLLPFLKSVGLNPTSTHFNEKGCLMIPLNKQMFLRIRRIKTSHRYSENTYTNELQMSVCFLDRKVFPFREPIAGEFNDWDGEYEESILLPGKKQFISFEQFEHRDIVHSIKCHNARSFTVYNPLKITDDNKLQTSQESYMLWSKFFEILYEELHASYSIY